MKNLLFAVLFLVGIFSASAATGKLVQDEQFNDVIENVQKQNSVEDIATKEFSEFKVNVEQKVLKMNTKIQVKCVSKKESENWNEDKPIRTTIELEVPYDENSVYHKLSGGTNLELHTVNQEAANMFKIGGFYDVLISPTES